MTQNRKLTVFLCHSKDDKIKVRRLYSRLIGDKFDVWFDEERLKPGQDWDFEIQKSVRNSDVVIVCLSNGSVNKEGYIQKEIRVALDVADERPEGTIFLIPARLENCEVPERIKRFQWVDLFEKGGYSKLKEALHLRSEDLNIRFDSNEVLPQNSKDEVRVPLAGLINANKPFPQFNLKMANYREHDDAVDIALSLFPKKEKHDNLFALQVMTFIKIG